MTAGRASDAAIDAAAEIYASILDDPEMAELLRDEDESATEQRAS